MKTSWRTALQDCLRALPPPRTERVARRSALGRRLAETITADRDYPAGILSLMDGYALGEKAEEVYRIKGENRPGSGPGEALQAGTARRIFTGAELPAQAVRVIPQEMTKREGDQLRVVEYPETPFVRERGSEAHQGETVLTAGTRLRAVELAILATVGILQVAVTTRPRVAHLVTGDEISDPDAPLTGPQIRDSNSDLVAAVLDEIGQSLVDHRRVNDDREGVFAAVETMSQQADLLLISGGASVGDHDHARAALEAAGFTFIAHGINVRPGKPVGLARRGEQWAVALPGNPVSHLVALQLFVLPLLLALEGMEHPEPELLRGHLLVDVETAIPRRETFWPSQLSISDGRFDIQPLRFLTSGDLFGSAGAQALLFLPSDQALPRAGEEVYFLPLQFCLS